MPLKSYIEIKIQTTGEKFQNITTLIQETLSNTIEQNRLSDSGILFISCPHTSCALTINEAYEESAQLDMQSFLKHLAPRDLPFIVHTTEGPDDSPSHMKSMLLQQSLSLIVDHSKMLLGTWQGIYLAEFRDQKKTRSLYLKYSPDQKS